MFRSRETENFEYLKNVILHFMISDSTSREQLIKPIATVLHFTPNEVSENISIDVVCMYVRIYVIMYVCMYVCIYLIHDFV